MIILILTFIACLFASPLWATDRYVVATGGASSGACLTLGTACTPAQAKTVSVPGDRQLWQSGNYTGLGEFDITTGGTSDAARITYQSATRHGAIIESDCGSQIQTIRVRASFITFKGFKIDGNACNWIGIDIYHSDAGIVVNGTIIEDVHLYNLGGRGMRTLRSTNTILRYNIIENTGNGGDAVSCCAEGVYVSSSSAAQFVTGLQAYGNTIRNYISNGIDQKQYGQDLNWHHNLLDTHSSPAAGQVTNDPSTGIFVNNDSVGGITSRFQDNIVRNGTTSGLYAIFRTQEKNIDVNRNVIHDITNASRAMSIRDTAGVNQNWTSNTWCNTSSTIEKDPVSTVANTTGNLFNQSQSTCNAEVTRIISEIAARPVLAVGAGTIADATPTLIDLIWTVSKFSPLTSVDSTKFSCTVAGVARAVNSASIVGANVTRLVLASGVTGGQAVVCAATAGAVVNSGLMGATWISDLASSAAFSSFTVTNNVGGSPPTFTLDVTAYQIYSIQTIDGLLVKQPGPNALISAPTTIARGSAFILVTQVDGTDGNPPAVGVKLRYKKNGGSITDVPDVIGADGIVFLTTSGTSSNIPAEGTVIAECLDGVLTDVPGSIQASAFTIPTFDLAQDQCISMGYRLKFDRAATPGDVFTFFLYDQVGDPINVSPAEVPTVTVGKMRIRK